MEDVWTERYAKLGISEALSRSCDYADACVELSFILRVAYSKMPKNLQQLVFQDTLSAFWILSDVQTSSAISSAHLLYQASEASFPKQKKATAASEFKRSVIQQKRRSSRDREENEGSRQLPEDLLLHIFSYLDLKSLVSASSVSRSWNSTSNDSILWETQYSLYFGNYERAKEPVESLDWKKCFKIKYKGGAFGKSTSKRVYCAHCKSIIWTSSICLNSAHECLRLPIKCRTLKPVTPKEILKYLLGEPLLEDSDSNDSDSEEILFKFPKMWAYTSFSD